jgi:two-component system KDP operon response regulator KdpE
VRREHPDAEVIVISREYSEADCIEVLQRGADYLARPFRRDDLLARVRVAGWRLFNATGSPRYCRHGPLILDLFDRKVSFDGQPIALSTLGATDSSTGRRVLHTLGLLRRRIERDPRHPKVLLSEARFGYRLAASPARSLTRAGP